MTKPLKGMPTLAMLAAAFALATPPPSISARSTDRMIRVAPGVELFVHEEGRGDPVLVLHGGPGLDSRYLSPDLAPLARHHRVIYYDQRGSGRSTVVADVTADVLVSDLEALRRALNLRQAPVLGHSWG